MTGPVALALPDIAAMIEAETAALPALGAAIRGEFLLDPAFLTVNHGSYGATPRMVLAVQDEWRRRMEAQTTRFMQRDYPSAIRDAAAALAGFVGAAPADLAFVDNATTGCNAILRSLAFAPGDEIVMLTHGYAAVTKTVRYVIARSGAVLVEVPVAFPTADGAPLDEDALLATLSAAFGPRTKLAVLDHITSPSGILLPVQRMVAACRAAGVAVLIDGAHSPGMVPLDMADIDADWYVGNCHKWLMAPKGAAFLWAAPDRQEGIHPLTISHGYGAGYLAEFDWTGTRDPSAALSVPAAIAFHHTLGGPALMRRNAALAAQAATLVASHLGTEAALNQPGIAMTLVRLPLSGTVDAPRALALRQAFLDAGTDVPVSPLNGHAWLRLSAQAYNEIADYEQLADIAAKVCAQTFCNAGS